jgi:hypothetical protein
MAVYPASLPGPLIDGYMISPVDQTVRTEFEAGAARVRRRTYARNDLLDVSFAFTGAQLSAFRTWFEGDAAGGAEWFDVSLDLGEGPSDQEARFKGPWKASKDGLMWKVTAQLEVR